MFASSLSGDLEVGVLVVAHGEIIVSEVNDVLGSFQVQVERGSVAYLGLRDWGAKVVLPGVDALSEGAGIDELDGGVLSDSAREKGRDSSPGNVA